MISLPTAPATPNERVLSSYVRERFSGLTTATVTLTNVANEGTELVMKNGAALDPNGGASGYSIAGATLTLGTALIAGDVVLVFYHARG